MQSLCSEGKAATTGLLIPVFLLTSLGPLGLFSPLAGGRAAVCHEGCTLSVGYRAAPVPRWEQFLPLRSWHLISSFDVAAFLRHR